MKWTRRILIAVIILAGLITALWWEENWRGQKIWEESCARLRAAGEPVEIADIIPPMIPDEENVAAAPIFAELFKDEESARLRRDAFSEGRVQADGTFLHPPRGRPFKSGDDSLIQEWRDFVRRCRPSFLPAPENSSAAEAILFLLSDFDEEWHAVAEAVRRPSCRWPVDYHDPSRVKAPQLQAIQRFRERAEPRLQAYASAGNWTAYSKGVCMKLALSRHIMASATGASSQILAIGCQGLDLRALQDVVGVANFDEAGHQAIQEQVEHFTLQDSLPGMRVERIASTSFLLQLKGPEIRECLSWIQTRNRYPQWLDGLRAESLSLRPHGWKLAEAAAFQDRAAQLQRMWSTDGASVDWQAFASVESEMDRRKEHTRWLSLEGVTDPGLSVQLYLFRKLVERQALSNSIVAWCAVQRFRLNHGRLPNTLEELRPTYLAKIPVDPIDCQSLRYAIKGDDSFILYSIAWNRTDDGGKQGSRRDQRDWVWASNPLLLQNESDGENQPDSAAAQNNSRFSPPLLR